MTPPAPPLVAFDTVTRRFDGEIVLDSLSFAVGRGEFVALLGPSGCGKSTVLRLVAGLDRPESGRVAAPADGIGYVLQDPTLMPWASALDNVALPLRFDGVTEREARERAAHALARVGLADAAAKTPREMSGGMRMRTAVARALVGDPRVLLMDEPFAALDEITRFRLGDDLTRLRAEGDLTILFVTHSVFEAVALADRVLVMGAGHLAADLPVVAPHGRGAAFRASADFAATAARVSAALEAAMAQLGRLDEAARAL